MVVGSPASGVAGEGKEGRMAGEWVVKGGGGGRGEGCILAMG